MIYIYKHTNKLTGESYIGQTNNFVKRFENNGKNYKSSPKFWKAIQNFGWENFTHEILEQTESSKKANSREQFYIEKFDTVLKGYNTDVGGYVKRKEHSSKDSTKLNPSEKTEVIQKLTSKINSLNKVENIGIFERRYVKFLIDDYKIITMCSTNIGKGIKRQLRNLKNLKDYTGYIVVSYYDNIELPNFLNFKAKKILLCLKRNIH